MTAGEKPRVNPAPGSPRGVVLCADDYGMNEGVNRAILDLASAGRISATSCMTNASGWPDAAGPLAASGASIGIGLHLTLTWGRPLGRMPLLAPAGALPRLAALTRLSLSARLDRDEIRREIERQLDRFEDALGRAPDFVDGHQHVHVMPGIRGPLLAALKARYPAGTVWLRDPSERRSSILMRRLSAGKAAFVSMLARGFRRDADAVGYSTNQGFSGFSPFDPGRDPGRDMEAFLSGLGEKPLVMCHPGLPDSAGRTDEVAPARGVEHGYLASAAFPALLAARDLRLVARPA